MTDKVQKIREEIEKIKTVHSSVGLKESNPDVLVVQVCTNLLSFIDSLQEEPEPQFKVGDIIRSKHWDTAVHKITSMDDKSYCLDNGGKIDLSSQQLWELVKEPVNEEWIEELRTKLDSMSKEEFEQVWGKYRVEEEEPVSEELEEAAEGYAVTDEVLPNGKVMINFQVEKAFKAGAKWQKEQFEKNRLAACDRQTGEEAEIELDFVMSIIENEHRQPTFDDAIKYGMRLKEKEMQSTIELAEDHSYFAGRTKTIDEIKETLLSEVLPCFMHGGEADEVVAKLEEVLNQKK